MIFSTNSRHKALDSPAVRHLPEDCKVGDVADVIFFFTFQEICIHFLLHVISPYVSLDKLQTVRLMNFYTDSKTLNKL